MIVTRTLQPSTKDHPMFTLFIDTYGKRILLHGVAGYCWADPADLVTRPGT